MKILLAFVGLALFAVVVSLIMAFPVMWLWNWLIPTIFGLIEITVWQAWGLGFLSSLLFKSNTVSNSK